MKIIFCGYGRAGKECFYQIINFLNENLSEIIVFTHNKKENKEFISCLRNNKITYSFENINKNYNNLKRFNPDILISAYYRNIIEPKILKLVNYKAMNLHPSILPAYRGTKSSVWALINNEKTTGISFHYINEKIDDGNIILQKKIKILDTDDAFTLYHKLISLFIINFPEAFRRLIKNHKGRKQKGKISYYKRELPFNGVRCFANTTYEEAKQFVKALNFPGYKGAFFKYKCSKKIEINSIEELKKYKNLFKISK